MSKFNYKASKKWINWHKSKNVRGKFKKIFYPSDGQEMKGNIPTTQDIDFKSGLKGIMDCVSTAMKDGTTLRAYGSRWSLSKIAYNKGYMSDTASLNYCKVGMEKDANQLASNYQSSDKASKLCFVQAGVFIKALNKTLLDKGLALKTTGASDGQKLAGALSTGTHGSANQIGSMIEYVKAIHIVIPLDDQANTTEHVLIQQERDPVIDPGIKKVAWLDNARLITSDEMYDAAVVSFGCFGHIHGYILEAVDQYAFRYHAWQFQNKKAKSLMNAKTQSDLARELSKLTKVTDKDKLPYHFSILLNPYRNGDSQFGTFIQVMEKIGPSTTAAAFTEDDGLDIHDYGDWESVTKNKDYTAYLDDTDGDDDDEEDPKVKSGKPARRKLFGNIVNAQLLKFCRITSGRSREIKFVLPSQIFSKPDSCGMYTSQRLKGTSLEFAVALKDWDRGVDEVLKVTDKGLLPAPLGIRFLPPNNSTLAFTQYEDLSVTFELPGPYSWLFPQVPKLHKKLFKGLLSAQPELNHSYHWGQQFPIFTTWLMRAYGGKITQWQNQRRMLLTEKGRKIFANKLTNDIKLTK